MRSLLVALLCVLSACGTNQSEAPKAETDEFELLQNGNEAACPELYEQISFTPEVDAEVNFREGDPRLIVVHGVGSEILGGPSEIEDTALECGRRCLVRIGEGLGDVIDENTCLSFQWDAREFARRYNAKMFSLTRGVRARG